MRENQKNSEQSVFFNASVILAGLKSPSGGSGKLLSLSAANKINGVISEIILDEVLRHTADIGLKSAPIQVAMKTTFSSIQAAPEESRVAEFNKIVIDSGDAHVLASCHETKADFLVTLDKKHLLILREKIKWVRIVSPGELIGILSKKVPTR